MVEPVSDTNYGEGVHTWDGALTFPSASCSGSSISDAGLLADESALLTTRLPLGLSTANRDVLWNDYQRTLAQFLIRMGSDNPVIESVSRVPRVRDLEGIYTRLALIPKLGQSAWHNIGQHDLRELFNHIAGECSLMELSAAAGYRTFCLPELVRGLLKSGKMREKSVSRMLDTFDFLNTMVQYPFDHPRTVQQFERTNELHRQYRVAGAGDAASRDLFKYIALNMFYVGPSMRPDLTPHERRALCGLAVLVGERMGHTLSGSVHEFEDFIAAYEAGHMFDRADRSPLRLRAIAIAHASREALEKIPTISRARIHSYVPYKVKQLLEIE